MVRVVLQLASRMMTIWLPLRTIIRRLIIGLVSAAHESLGGGAVS